MYRVHNFTQAYSQAPWRKQLQWIGLIMLVLVLIAMVAGIYLSVSAQASTAGREIQMMYNDMEIMRRDIENLESQLAFLDSNAEMQKRAENLGFKEIDSDEILFILVPGYLHANQIDLGNAPGSPLQSSPTLSPEYTQSLIDWISERVFYPASPLVKEVEP